MAASRPLPVHPSEPVVPIECRLDLAGLRAQRDRYRTLGRELESLERSPGRLELRFGPAVDTELLAQAIAVERECCPFFAISHDRARHRVVVTVAGATQDPALDALRSALTGQP